MRTLVIAAALAALPLSLASAQTPPELEDTERLIEAAVAAGEAPSIALAVLRDGETAWMHAAGWADIAGRRAATPDTIYRIGSVSKSITATATALAERDGAIDLARTIPGASPALRGVTYADLLNMRAGLLQAVYYHGRDGDTLELDEGMFERRFTLAAPSTRARHGYSNMGPQIVSRAVAEAVGEPFAAYAERTLLAPLGMSRTFEHWRDAPAEFRARSYKSDLSLYEPEFEVEPGAGAGWVSSLRDLTHYAQFHLGRTTQGPLGALELQRLHTPLAEGHYAFGWGVVGSGEMVGLISDGEVNGGRAIVLLAPQRRVGVIALTNGAYDLWGVVLSAMEASVPGFGETFGDAIEQLEARLAEQAAGAYPAAGPWRTTGWLQGERRRVRLGLALDAQGELDLALGRFAAPVRAQRSGLEEGFTRWTIPCPAALEACTSGAEATLALTAAPGGSIEGAVFVESRLGLFPYAVRLNRLRR